MQFRGYLDNFVLPSKALGCYGDGGASFTNDDEATRANQILLYTVGKMKLAATCASE